MFLQYCSLSGCFNTHIWKRWQKRSRTSSIT